MTASTHAAASAEQARAADDGGGDGEQHGVVAAGLRARPTGAARPAPCRRRRRRSSRSRTPDDADERHVDAGAAGRFGVAADGVDVPAPARCGSSRNVRTTTSTRMNGTASGTPRSGLAAAEATGPCSAAACRRPRSRASADGLRATTRLYGLAARPCVWRWRTFRQARDAAKPATTTTHRIQPSDGDRFLLAMATMTSRWSTAIVPPSLAMMRTTPCHARKKARVTTNDGMPTFATSQPVSGADGDADHDRRRAAAIHGRVRRCRAAMPSTTAQTPAVAPADRSISPSSSTKTRPMPMSVIGAAWVSRLAKLRVDEEVGVVGGDAEEHEQHDEAEHGRHGAELAAAHARTRRPRSARSSEYCSRVDGEAGARPAAGRTWEASVRGHGSASDLDLLDGLQADVAGAAGGDQLDHLGVGHRRCAAPRRRPGRGRASTMRSATSKTSFMLWEMSTTPRPLVGEAAHQFEHLAGLGHAEGGGGLVEHDDLALPQHRLGDGDRLALAAGQAGAPSGGRSSTVRTDRRVERLAGEELHRRPRRDRGPWCARGRGTCSGRCRGCRTARGPGTRSRCRGAAASRRAVDGHRPAVEQRPRRCRSCRCR